MPAASRPTRYTGIRSGRRQRHHEHGPSLPSDHSARDRPVPQPGQRRACSVSARSDHDHQGVVLLGHRREQLHRVPARGVVAPSLHHAGEALSTSARWPASTWAAWASQSSASGSTG